MPGAATTNVEMTSLQGLADLERLEGLWLEEMAGGHPESVAITLRLLLAQMTMQTRRLMIAMVLDRLDAEERQTALEAVGQLGSGPTPQNGTTIATFGGTQGHPLNPITQS
jgi:hypothetical protein